MEILRRVSSEYGLGKEVLTGTTCREKTIIEARRKAMRMIRAECGLSLSELGRVFGRNPSSISRLIK